MYLGLNIRDLENLSSSAKYHDVGKLLINPKVLYKKEKLTEDEFNYIKKHPELSHKILKETSNFNDIVLRAVLEHHERIDGEGYPFGLKGDEISDIGKILTLCDCYEAMTAERCYKKSLNTFEVVNEIENNLGMQFDQHLGTKFIDFILLKDKKLHNFNCG